MTPGRAQCYGRAFLTLKCTRRPLTRTLKMVDLGNKFECFNCGLKFYDLGKSVAICPACGADQKDAEAEEGASKKPSKGSKKKTKKK